MLAGRLRFTPYPAGLGAPFEAPTRFSSLFLGLVVTEPPVVGAGADLVRDQGKGTEALRAEDATLEARYEALLARAENAARRITEKGWRPWRDLTPSPFILVGRI